MKDLYRIIKDRKQDKTTIWYLTSHSDIITSYLIYCIMKYNTPSDYEYWERRIYDFIPALPKLRTTGAYPSSKLLRKKMVDSNLNDLRSLIHLYHKDVETQKLDISYYNEEVMYNCLMMFFEWMIDELSINGIVDRNKYHNKLKEVIDKYNREISNYDNKNNK